MSSICIIVTGQLRKFFSSDMLYSFKRLINNCKKVYSTIYIICIINEATESEISKLNNYLNSLSVLFYIDEYDKNSKYINIFKEINKSRLSDPAFIKMSEIYNKAKGEIQKIMTTTIHTIYDTNHGPFGFHLQWHQLEIGINHLLEYEQKNNIIFDMGVRMRFDTSIVDRDFYPYMPENDLLKQITFNNKIETQLKTKMNELGISTIDQYIQFMKDNQITFPKYISDYPDTSFGCYFFNNYVSLENIKNCKEKNILYCFVDHLIFGKRDTFIKLKDFFKKIGTYESNLNQKGMQAFFSSECQLLNFGFNNDINLLIYTCHSMFILRR